MKHRIKNILATVQAIAVQTIQRTSNEERTAFSAGLGTLASAHDLLTIETGTELFCAISGKEHSSLFEIRLASALLLRDEQTPGLMRLNRRCRRWSATSLRVKYRSLSTASGRVRVIFGRSDLTKTDD
jgi:hypothetical protein